MSAYSQKRTFGPSLNRIFLSVFGPDRLGAGFHLFGPVLTVSFPQQLGIILQARNHIRMLGSEGLFLDRQRALVERFGLGVVALGLRPSLSAMAAN